MEVGKEEGVKEGKEGESKKADAEPQTASAALTSGLREFPEVGGEDLRTGPLGKPTAQRDPPGSSQGSPSPGPRSPTSFLTAHLHGSAPQCAINSLSTRAGQGEGRNSSAPSSALQYLPSSSETQGTPESPNLFSGQTQRALNAGR